MGVRVQLQGMRDAAVQYRDIVNSVRKAIVVLDDEFRVLFANLSYYQLFGEREEEVVGRHFNAISRGVWNKDELQALLHAVMKHDVTVNNFLLEETFPIIGTRSISLTASLLMRDGASRQQILVTCTDATKSAADDLAKDNAIEHVKVMMTEVQHRVKNNLGAIMSMLRLEKRQLADPDAVDTIERIATRVESIASLYELLATSDTDETVSLVPYFERVCEAIERFSGAERKGWSIAVVGEDARVDVDKAIAIGAVVNELVTNASKYAFADDDEAGKIVVRCEPAGNVLHVSVTDNGIGLDRSGRSPKSTGLGMRLVDLYLERIGAKMRTESDPDGTSCLIFVPYPENPDNPEVASTRPADIEDELFKLRQLAAGDGSLRRPGAIAPRGVPDAPLINAPMPDAHVPDAPVPVASLPDAPVPSAPRPCAPAPLHAGTEAVPGSPEPLYAAADAPMRAMPKDAPLGAMPEGERPSAQGSAGVGSDVAPVSGCASDTLSSGGSTTTINLA